MRFDRVRLALHDAPGHPVEMSVVNADPHDRYVMKITDGLGPPDITLGLSNPLSGKRRLQGRKVNGRELVMRIGLNPLYLLGESPGDLRAELYQFFMPSAEPTLLTEPTEVRVSFLDEDSEVAYAMGYMSKFEIVPFSQNPEVQLTLSCTTPALVGPVPYLMEYDPAAPSPVSLDVKGNVPTGFEARLLIGQNTSSVKLTVQPTGNEFTVFHDFTVGQELEISTIAGERRIELGDGTSLIGKLASTDDWVSIQNGSTGLAAEGGGGTPVNFLRVSYPVLYWGV